MLTREFSMTEPEFLQGLPHSFKFLNRLFWSAPPNGLKDLSPQELQIEAARREVLEIKGEQDLGTLHEHAVSLVYARELLKAKNNELKQMLTESQVISLHLQYMFESSPFQPLCKGVTEFVCVQTHVHSDETITHELVQAKLDLADAAYERLQLQSAFDRIANKNRILSSRLTQAAVDRDLLAHRLARANEMSH